MRFTRPTVALAAALMLGAPMVAAPAFAAEIQTTADVAVSEQKLGAGSKFEVTVDMSVPDSAQSGDTFRLALGPNLKMYSGAIDLKTIDGSSTVATVTQHDGYLEYKFTDYVNGKTDVTTSLKFWAEFVPASSVQPGDKVPVQIVINGVTYSADKQIEYRPTDTSVVNASYKWMSYSGKANQPAVWGIVVDDNAEPVTNLKISDIPGEGIKLRCPGVSDALGNGWVSVWMGTVRDSKEKTLWNTLSYDKYVVSCAEDKLDVTVKNVPAGNVVEVRGTVAITEHLDQYLNKAIVSWGTGNTEEFQSTLYRYGASGFGAGVDASVEVGDFVWLDSNGNGVQDSGESGIEGVVLVIVDQDGNPVTDVKNKPVGPVTTDANGKYSFKLLKPLPAGKYYTVKIDQAASAEVLGDLVPTAANAGDADKDSSIWSAASGDLSTGGAKDLTLDFGFVTPTTQDPEADPSGPGAGPSGPEGGSSPTPESPGTPPATTVVVTPPVTPPISEDQDATLPIGPLETLQPAPGATLQPVPEGTLQPVPGAAPQPNAEGVAGILQGGAPEVVVSGGEAARVVTAANTLQRGQLAKTGAGVGAIALLSGTAIASGLGALRIRGRK